MATADEEYEPFVWRVRATRPKKQVELPELIIEDRRGWSFVVAIIILAAVFVHWGLS